MMGEPVAVTTMSSAAASAAPSTPGALDRAVDELRGHAVELARLGPAARAALVRQCVPRLVDVAPAWVAAGARAKGLGDFETAEEWLAGPLATVRMMRLL